MTTLTLSKLSYLSLTHPQAMNSLLLFFILSFFDDVSSICDDPSHKASDHKYLAEWSSLDKRPLPKWYDKAKIGIFLHWGVFSVPSYGSEWFWENWETGNDIDVYMKKNFRPGFTYQDFGPMFQAEFFDPRAWAKLFFKAGMKYVVLTSKHHEGFTLFPSKRSFSWNSMDIGPKRDIVGELAEAVRAEGLKFGIYHSLYEWHNPIYLLDKTNGFRTHVYTKSKLWPDLTQLVRDYHPSIVWADGDWEANDTYWKSKEFIAWLYNETPVKDEVVVNDRWGIGIPCNHGDFYNCVDIFNPGILQQHKWENAFTLDMDSWGYRRNMKVDDVMTFHQILSQVVPTVSCGGNALINVGPTKEGTIAPIFQDRLLSLGEWLQRNGEAIYETSPWNYQQDSIKKNSSIWYTCLSDHYNPLKPIEIPKDRHVKAVFAIILADIRRGIVEMKDIVDLLMNNECVILILDDLSVVKWRISNGVAVIALPDDYPKYPVLKIMKKNSDKYKGVLK